MQDELNYGVVDFTNPSSIETYAKHLEGMTFREVLNLGIVPEGVEREYNSRRYKGGMGTLIEERFFGYKANSDERPDFPEAGVELKTTCFDVKQNGDASAGERLVLTMIPYDKPIEDDFYESHFWDKSGNLLLIYYHRDKTIDAYDQRIEYAMLFAPPEDDLKIIKDDYTKICGMVKAGRADELSESQTSYLGACTKGATAAKSLAAQFYPPHTKAKRRAFCFKRQYMDYVLHHYFMGQANEANKIIMDSTVLENQTFEQFIMSTIRKHIGKTDRQLCKEFNMPYTGNKAQWTTLAYRMLGLRDDHAEEFQKAAISVRTVRLQEKGGIKESISLNTFEFKDLVAETWEDSALHDYFEETRFFFVAFRKGVSASTLETCGFWSMPVEDIEGPLRACWEQARKTIVEGVRLTLTIRGDGPFFENNLPKMTENRVAHVRPHASHAAYLLADGTEIGNIERDGSQLPDGRYMTKQSFWLNSDYVYEVVKLL